MFRFRFFIIVLFLCMLFSHAYALKPAELHPVRNKMNKDASVISTSSSPFAKLHGIPPRAVNLSDGFWKKRFTVNMERSIPTFFTLLNNVGARDKLLDRKNKARGNSDADLAKWMEAAFFVLQSEDNKQLRNVMWNWRLLHAGGEAIFTDIMELALYNGVLSGVSIGGDKYFYWNPLLSRFDFAEEQYVEGAKDLLALKKSRGTSLNIRQPYYRTPCCIPNIQRIIASLPGYIYSTSAKGLWIHLYHSGRLNWHLENGKELTIHQNTKYPWENTVEITFENVPAEEFSLFFRVPGWTTSAGVSVNGRFFRSIHKSEHYHEIRRSWEKKDRIEIVFDMPVRVVHAHPHLRENSGCVAIRRGPLIYCVESVDQQNVSVFDIVLPLNLSSISRDFEVMYDPNLLGGNRNNNE